MDEEIISNDNKESEEDNVENPEAPGVGSNVLPQEHVVITGERTTKKKRDMKHTSKKNIKNKRQLKITDFIKKTGRTSIEALNERMERKKEQEEKEKPAIQNRIENVDRYVPYLSEIPIAVKKKDERVKSNGTNFLRFCVLTKEGQQELIVVRGIDTWILKKYFRGKVNRNSKKKDGSLKKVVSRTSPELTHNYMQCVLREQIEWMRTKKMIYNETRGNTNEYVTRLYNELLTRISTYDKSVGEIEFNDLNTDPPLRAINPYGEAVDLYELFVSSDNEQNGEQNDETNPRNMANVELGNGMTGFSNQQPNQETDGQLPTIQFSGVEQLNEFSGVQQGNNGGVQSSTTGINNQVEVNTNGMNFESGYLSNNQGEVQNNGFVNTGTEMNGNSNIAPSVKDSWHNDLIKNHETEPHVQQYGQQDTQQYIQQDVQQNPNQNTYQDVNYDMNQTTNQDMNQNVYNDESWKEELRSYLIFYKYVKGDEAETFYTSPITGIPVPFNRDTLTVLRINYSNEILLYRQLEQQIQQNQRALLNQQYGENLNGAIGNPNENGVNQGNVNQVNTNQGTGSWNNGIENHGINTNGTDVNGIGGNRQSGHGRNDNRMFDTRDTKSLP